MNPIWKARLKWWAMWAVIYTVALTIEFWYLSIYGSPLCGHKWTFWRGCP